MTLVASLGPLLVTLSVNVTFDPTSGVLEELTFVIDKSALEIIVTVIG